jgi:hypothetical protein
MHGANLFLHNNWMCRRVVVKDIEITADLQKKSYY